MTLIASFREGGRRAAACTLCNGLSCLFKRQPLRLPPHPLSSFPFSISVSPSSLFFSFSPFFLSINKYLNKYLRSLFMAFQSMSLSLTCSVAPCLGPFAFGDLQHGLVACPSVCLSLWAAAVTRGTAPSLPGTDCSWGHLPPHGPLPPLRDLQHLCCCSHSGIHSIFLLPLYSVLQR